MLIAEGVTVAKGGKRHVGEEGWSCFVKIRETSWVGWKKFCGMGHVGC